MFVLKNKSLFKAGVLSMIPISIGVIPFGLVMGATYATADFSFLKAATMNLLVYAGTSQLAAIDLLSNGAIVVVIVLSGLVINMRFVLYSADLAPHLKQASFIKKISAAFLLTDQSYSSMRAKQESFENSDQTLEYYFGSALSMLFIWHGSVLLGYLFGNFIPSEWSIDFAVPLSFICLCLPTLKNKTDMMVFIFSSILAVTLYQLPHKLGLIVTALCALGFAHFITQSKVN